MSMKIIFTLSTLALVLCFGAIWFYTRHSFMPFISLFPIEHYSQHLSEWIKPSDPHYEQLLLTKEKQDARVLDWQRRHYGEISPWDLTHVKEIISYAPPSDVKTSIIRNLEEYSNVNKSARKLGYGANFRLLPPTWIERLQTQTNLTQFDSLTMNSSRRAITIVNTNGRDLPTNEAHFYHYTFAGEGYPFDNLQYAHVWAGTPVYVLGETLARDWVLVQTPDFRVWLRSSDIAYVDDSFISRWRQAATEQLIALTDTQIPIIDEDSKLFWSSGYIGMAFPGKQQDQFWRIMIPVRDEHGLAQIHYAMLAADQASSMPITATPHHFVEVLGKLMGRPYGWGGLYFYNDCASELKNLFTPFGLWLPIHSSDQVDPKIYPIKVKDLSKSDRETRLKYLMSEGHPFMTVVYVGGHVILYLGTYPNPDDPQHRPVALSYQNVWAMEPNNAPPGQERRSIIGGAVLLPTLPYYPEDPGLSSDVDDDFFILGYLNL
jgi:hypothetical protein